MTREERNYFYNALQKMFNEWTAGKTASTPEAIAASFKSFEEGEMKNITGQADVPQTLFRSFLERLIDAFSTIGEKLQWLCDHLYNDEGTVTLKSSESAQVSADGAVFVDGEAIYIEATDYMKIQPKRIEIGYEGDGDETTEKITLRADSMTSISETDVEIRTKTGDVILKSLIDAGQIILNIGGEKLAIQKEDLAKLDALIHTT